jgi:methyl-accepting chemotaxis protein
LLAGGAALAGLAGAAVARSVADGRGGAMDNVRKALPGKSRSHGISLPKLPKRRGDVKGGVRNISRNVSKAAKQADQIGQRVSSVANAVQRVSETADNAAKKA